MCHILSKMGLGGRIYTGVEGSSIWSGVGQEGAVIDFFVHRGATRRRRRALDLDARRDAHGHQFLEEELAGVRDVDADNLRADALAVLVGAPVGGLPLVGARDEAARGADVDRVWIRIDEHPVAQEVGHAVRDEAVALHLAHAQAAVARPTLHGLARQHRHGPARPCVDLVVDQVLEALVERGPEEDLCSEGSSRVARVHDLVAVALEAKVVEQRRDLVD
mmetsp:Transcript_29041/g.100264  ORF Transcript_29041/g.100264 Transcript_29041/m.100264 type:complete len:220 (-) Transcript_29041:1000-1659(-)